MGDGDRLEHADTVAAQSDRPSLAATQPDGTQRISSPVLHLTRGGAIGRYIVVDQLAAGGMGTVYAAYDPELDRKVAIKVLRWSDEGSAQHEARARMMREAQATARLAHPNVVAVYDVGPVAEQVFIAMELVEGATLASWMNAETRTLGEILDMFGQAGRGLAAAHHAGLVHRDFKPENVLVGKDGRARVADFGLVREADAPPEDESTPPSRSSMLSVALTQVGTIMGTPRYMAPEQRARKPADARADQYSFCVSLYEALHGRVPHVDTDPTAVDPDPQPAESRAIPAHVRAAIDRGLAEDPAARWPSMDELLAELARDPSAQRRRWLVAGGGVLAAAAAVALVLGRGSTPDPCGGAEARLAGVWGVQQKAATERAFTATHVPFAPAVYASVAEDLDRYAAAWRHSYEDSCRATHERHDQSMELLDLRSACLGKRRAELGALATLLTNADAALVRNAASAVASLPPIAECDDVTSLQAPSRLPSDPGKRRAIDDAHAELAQLDALLYAGRYKDALVRAKALAARAHELDYRPLDADAALLLGKILLRAGDAAGADREVSFYAGFRGDVVAGEMRVVSDDGVAAQVYRASGHHRIVRDGALDVDGFTGGPEIVSDLADQRDAASGAHHVAVDGRVDRHFIPGGGDVAGHLVHHAHRAPGRNEIVTGRGLPGHERRRARWRFLLSGTEPCVARHEDGDRSDGGGDSTRMDAVHDVPPERSLRVIVESCELGVW